MQAAVAKVAEMKKGLANRDLELSKLKGLIKQQKEELPRQTIEKFLKSRAFTVAAQISCENLIKAAY